MSRLQISSITKPDKHCGRAAVVVYRQRKGRLEFLLVSRSSDRSQFVLPGGKLDTKESLRAAARRECLEESGVKVRLEGTLAQFDHLSSRGSIKPTRVFLGQVNKQLPSPEGREVIWARYEDLDSYPYDVPEPTLEVLDYAAECLNEISAAA